MARIVVGVIGGTGLGEALGALQWLAIGCVVLASVGASRSA